MAKPIDVEAARKMLNYDPETGVIRWRVDRIAGRGRVTHRAGSIAGSYDGKGHRVVKFNKNRVYAHRLAWLLFHGEAPPDHLQMDHINGQRDDNRICNLRLATSAQNAANRALSKKNAAGLKGACFHRHSGLWRAQCRVDGRLKSLGYYATAEQAHQAHMEAARLLYGDFASDGRR